MYIGFYFPAKLLAKILNSRVKMMERSNLQQACAALCAEKL